MNKKENGSGDRLGFMGPTYFVGSGVMLFYRQVFLPIGVAWLM